MKKLLGSLAFAGVALLPRPSAAADLTGNTGVLWSVQLNAPGSSEFSKYRGAIELKVWLAAGGAAKKKTPTLHQYMWGGANCPNRDLQDGQVAVLMQALGTNLRIEPAYVSGQLPNTRCLVSFKVVRPKKNKNN